VGLANLGLIMSIPQIYPKAGYSQYIRNFNIKDLPQYVVPALFFVSEDCWLQAALFI
jgi:hypothetical protein